MYENVKHFNISLCENVLNLFKNDDAHICGIISTTTNNFAHNEVYTPLKSNFDYTYLEPSFL